MNSIMTLNDDSDYVRAIDYSEYKHALYSACDNGIVRMWDINLGKIVTQINPHDTATEVRLAYYLYNFN